MKQLYTLVVAVAVVCLLVPTQSTHAVTAPQVLISELQTGSSLSANDEFIELYNQDLTPVDLTDWKVEYYPSSATAFGAPFRTIALSGVINPGQYFLLASTDYLSDSADLSFSKVLSASGGTLRLVDSDPLLGSSTQDVVGWGSASLAEGTKAVAPGDGKSLSRKPTTTGLQDTNNNAQDFEVLSTPSPTSGVASEPVETPPVVDPPVIPDPIPPPPEETVPDPPAPPEPTPSPIPEIPTTNQTIQITELLPNPASPATDDSDEFVELYNPNESTVVLDGFVLKSGSSLSYQQKLDGLSIAPRGYLTLFSRDTDLVLSNTAGKATLFAPDGKIMATTDPYESAPEGQSWSVINNVWQWTNSPTPSATNVLVVPLLKTASTSSAIKKATAKKSVASSTKGAKTAAAKKASSTAKPKKSTNPAVQPASTITEGRPLHPAVLGLAASGAVLYGLYEYRTDIRNYIRKLRRYRSARS